MMKSQVLSSLKGLSVLVTGGSSGLGLATVERLSKQGCIVAIVDIHEPKELPDNSYFIKADVTNEEDVVNALKAIDNKATKLDILVNCAGIFLQNEIFNIESQTPHILNDFERILEVNTTGTFNVIRLCCSLFTKNEPSNDKQKGVIINVASTVAFDGTTGHCAYAASKGAIVSMTLPLSRDLSKIGVRVVTIAPGLFDTPLAGTLPNDISNYYKTLFQFPKRVGHPDEFAHLVQTIIENPMLNGEVIRLDGAFRII